jgi:hypothetical protein
MRKTLYFDVGTEAKLKKIKMKMKNKVSESQVVRKALSIVSFDDMIEALKIDMEQSKVIDVTKE